MNAWLMPQGTTTGIAGTLVTPPPQPYDWAFSFAGPLAAGQYTLCVQATTDVSSVAINYLNLS
ncbi:MAG: hypothetical protein ACYC6M_15715 [Terriglobales bacterium]